MTSFKSDFFLKESTFRKPEASSLPTREKCPPPKLLPSLVEVMSKKYLPPISVALFSETFFIALACTLVIPQSGQASNFPVRVQP